MIEIGVWELLLKGVRRRGISKAVQ